MDKVWVEEKNAEHQAWLEKAIPKARKAIVTTDFLNDDEKADAIMMILNGIRDGRSGNLGFRLESCWGPGRFGDEKERKPYLEWLEENELVKLAYNFNPTPYDRFRDSEPVHLTGDIIITDPCYYILDEDWDRFCSGTPYEELGYSGISRGTIYGDWGCTTYDMDTQEEIGQFCADAAEVAVAELDKVLAKNPSFDYHIERPWTTTLIHDFDGDVRFVIEEDEYEWDGSMEKDYSVHVEGIGKNMKTGEDIHFWTSQTGL